MRCEDVLDLVDELVDAELDDARRDAVRAHLDGCAACEAVYRESTHLKRLLQRRAFRPPLPGGLASRILARARRADEESLSSRFRTGVTGLAAAVLAFITGWMFLSLLNPTMPSLAHATVVHEAVRRYESLSGATNPVVDTAAALREIREATGIQLDAVPEISGARLVGWSQDRFLDRTCVCLAYEDALAKSDERERRPEIVIFALPSDGSDVPSDDLHACVSCFEIKGGSTVFCFRQPSLSLNLVTTIDRTEMAKRLESLKSYLNDLKERSATETVR